MPFQQQQSFYWWEDFMSPCRQYQLAQCHSKLTSECAHLFLLKSNDCCFCNVSACACEFIPASGLNFPCWRRTIAPCKKIWAPLHSREASSRRPLFFADRAAHFEDLKVCINSFFQFLHVTQEVRLFSLLQNERFCSWTCTQAVASTKEIVSTAFSSRRWT